MISLRGLDPKLRPYAEGALATARQLGLSVTVTSTRRTWAEQTGLRQQYLDCLARGQFGKSSAPGCVYPANAPGDSAHQYGYAWDSICPPEQMAQWVKVRQQWGWHVASNDLIHAEVLNWRQAVVTYDGPTG